MSSTESNDLPVVEPRVAACRHLRNKGMYVYSDADGGESHEDYDNTIYWCLKTMKEYGPDDQMVAGPDCRDPARTCYEPI
jgi:hypothetical protein